MRLFNIFYFLYFTSLLSHAQDDKQALELLDEMSDKYKRMTGFTSTFTYIMNNLSENIVDSFQGKISVKEEMYVLLVEDQKIINDSKTVWTYLEELNEVTISDFDTGEQEISLNNIFEIYKSGFSYKYLGEENNLRLVEIYPEDQEKSYFKILFKIDTTGLLYSFSVFDKSNSTFVYMINDFKEEELANALFTFIPEEYPDIEVIDFR
ncbi:MAG: outer membrane lipoprotein carrier protein LolA [Flammeovirgaceae bacterium TMED290]|nr:MAG: outer membrane lipoprotein carrier protein LolA [Flammeovirgaceae bacterium TMED290]|tara:strand:- start:5122 stop:5745 length:624 start_codon:yes stop_codon:yes gene_type:complete